MSLANLANELINVLEDNAGLIAWAKDNLDDTFTVLKSNRKVEAISPNELPALIIELGDGRSEITVGNHQQNDEVQVFVSIAWSETNLDKSFEQRLALVPLMEKAIMSNPTLNSKVDGAAVTGFASDKNIFHPKHIMRFEITGEYPVYNN